jgi:hypothetical protein
MAMYRCEPRWHDGALVDAAYLITADPAVVTDLAPGFAVCDVDAHVAAALRAVLDQAGPTDAAVRVRRVTSRAD